MPAVAEASRKPGGLRVRLACFAIHKRTPYDLLAADAPTKVALKRVDAHGERVAAYVDPLRAVTVNTVDEGLALIEFNARGGPFLRTRGAGVPSRRLPPPTHATARREGGERRV